MNGVPTRPEKEFKVGAVRVAIWTNPRMTSDGKMFESQKVIVERTYKDSSGNFKSTNSLDLNDIPKAILGLKKAYEYLTAPKQEERGEQNMDAAPRRMQVPIP